VTKPLSSNSADATAAAAEESLCSVGMGGSDKPFTTRGVGKVWATNLTPDPQFGIARFSDAQVKDALRKGLRLEDGKPMAYPMSSYIAHDSAMTEEDLGALVAYLRSLRPAHKQVPARELTP
jgi:hypothetical protein